MTTTASGLEIIITIPGGERRLVTSHFKHCAEMYGFPTKPGKSPKGQNTIALCSRAEYEAAFSAYGDAIMASLATALATGAPFVPNAAAHEIAVSSGIVFWTDSTGHNAAGQPLNTIHIFPVGGAGVVVLSNPELEDLTLAASVVHGWCIAGTAANLVSKFKGGWHPQPNVLAVLGLNEADVVAAANARLAADMKDKADKAAMAKAKAKAKAGSATSSSSGAPSTP